MVLKESGDAPRFKEHFPDGRFVVNPKLSLVVADIMLSGVEPQVVLGHVAEFWRFHKWLRAID